MAFAEGWDRSDRWTLRFLDPELERDYQYADQAQGVRRARLTSLVAVCFWIALAMIGPGAVGVPPYPSRAICAAMVVLLLGTTAISRWATTQRRRDALGLGQQFAAGCGALLLTLVTGTVSTYAMPAIMLTAVFGYSITRHPFIGAVGIGAAYVVLFTAVAGASGLDTQLALQTFLVAATVLVGCVGAYLLERSLRAQFAQRRLIADLHDRVDVLLHQYLSPAVATTLIEDPSRAALGGIEAIVTVLFADLRGYTAYAEHRSPADVVAMLNAAFSLAVPIVLAEGGTVVQFMGDALMAVFNAPTTQPDHALRACRAALAIQEAIRGLPGADARPLFRVGINTGPALVGNIGAAEIRNYSAIGDATNVAARLQTYAAPGSVVIGARTYALVRRHARVRPLGTPELKGKTDPVQAYELLELAHQPRDTEP
jgi:class 3 adenylate cyclase